MNVDYVREQVNDKDIDIPFARRTLIGQAQIELREVASRRPVSGLLYGCWLNLLGTPEPEAVIQIVGDLQAVLLEVLATAAEFGKDVWSFLIPDGKHAYEDIAKDFDVAAAICRALDLLGWVIAYDEISPPEFADETEEEDDE